ncbi:MAG: DUF7507 domain-containing protein, partial [Planctomycetota bacterium]
MPLTLSRRGPADGLVPLVLAAAGLPWALAAPAPADEEPPGCNGNSIGTALIPTVEGVPVPPGECVIPGQGIDYIASVFVSPNDPGKPDVIYCDVLGGQLSVTFPDYEDLPLRPGQFVPVAGYPTTPVMEIPQFGNPDGADLVFTEPVPVRYIIEAAHANGGFLDARVDYGQTAYMDLIGQLQEPGFVLSDPPQEGTASITNALRLCLPEIRLQKTADPARVCEGVPTPVTYTFVVENLGEVDLTEVALIDDTCGPIEGPDGDDGDGLLNPGETWQYTCTAVVSGTTTNEATVSALAMTSFPPGRVIRTVVYTDTATATVTGNPPPVAQAGNDGPVCAGEAVQLTAGPDGGTYAWTGPGGFVSSEQNPVVDPAIAGVYCVVVTDANGCEDTACTTVVLEPCDGACCFPDGSCRILTQADCVQSGGEYQGDGTSCDEVTCIPLKGACCLPNGSCTVVTAESCDQLGGEYEGDGTDCAPNPCPPGTGACCLPDGSCLELTQEDCLSAGGGFQGFGVLCVDVVCVPVKGACCLADGSCTVLTAASCDDLAGEYQGAGT